MRKLVRAVLGGSIGVSATMGCGGGGGGGGTGGGPSTIIAKAAPSGDAQSGTVATSLTDSIRVLVQEEGNPKTGTSVAWSTTNGGTLSPASSITDAAGLAATKWTLGQTSGTQTARATLVGASGSPLSFTATATPDVAAAFTKNSGDLQGGVVSTAFDDPLAVKVADQFGNGIASVTVNWAVQSGDVTLGGGGTSVTNGSGIATKGVSGGPTTGAAVVRATTAGFPGTNLDFNLTVTLAPVRVNVGSFFFRSVKNGTEDPAVDTAKVGQPVRWSVSGTHTVRSTGSPSFTSSTTLNTGDTYTITFGAIGTYTYDCAIHGAAAMNGRVVVEP